MNEAEKHQNKKTPTKLTYCTIHGWIKGNYSKHPIRK